MQYTQRFSVAFEYPVYFTAGMIDLDNPVLFRAVARSPSAKHRLFVVIDGGLSSSWQNLSRDLIRYFDRHRLELLAEPYFVPGGEQVKIGPKYVADLHGALREAHVDRQSYVVIIGGGAVQDMAGYAASTAHRGIRVVRVPTTTLSQNDSGVSVKNGINAFGSKNFLGTFAPPFAVIDDIRFIRTLSDRDRRAGLAEAVKVALIRDRAFFEWIEDWAEELNAGDEAATSEMIRRSAIAHLEHVATSGDPFELGSARPLDYGHWAAHQLETMTAHELRHGEAVSIGMVLDARYAVLTGLLEEEHMDRISSLIARLGLPLWHPALENRALLQGLQEFREHVGGELTIRMLTEIGRGVDVHQIDEQIVERSVRWLKERAA